jgi:hypothetical protein
MSAFAQTQQDLGYFPRCQDLECCNNIDDDKTTLNNYFTDKRT